MLLDAIDLAENHLTYGKNSNLSSSKALESNSMPDSTANQVEVKVKAEADTICLEIPLTVTIRVNKIAEVSVTSPAENVSKLIETDEAKRVTDYSDRKGYYPNFLSNNQLISLPKLTEEMKRDCAINRMAKGGMDKYTLAYHHFSIVMNKVRKMAFYTAVNLDGTKIDRSIGRDDQWITDPRIGVDEQTNNSLYANNDLDRGHLVRRLDPVWGSVAKVANRDTFHYTNCTPQHKDFNQNEATWLGLENYILDNAIAEKFRISVFTGPVFRDDDKSYRGVKLPRQFWKVLVMVKNSKLSATAYLLSQEKLIRNLGDEAFSDDRRVKTYQVPIRQIEDLTGLSFGLNEFDPMEFAESTGIIPITSYKVIQV